MPESPTFAYSNSSSFLFPIFLIGIIVHILNMFVNHLPDLIAFSLFPSGQGWARTNDVSNVTDLQSAVFAARLTCP